MDIDACHALLPHDEPRAREALGMLHAQALAAGDTRTAWLASAAALVGIALEFVDFRGARDWCERFRAGLADFWPFPASGSPLPLPLTPAPPELGTLRICAAMLVLPTLLDEVSLDDHRVVQAAACLDAGLASDSPLDPDERLVLTKLLVDLLGLRMDTVTLLRVADRQQDRMRREPPAPVNQARWWLVMLAVHEYWGQPHAAQAVRHKLWGLVEAHELPEVRCALAVHDMPAQLKSGQLGRAERLHREIEALLPDMPVGYLPQGLRAQASFLAHRGEMGAALERIDRLLGHCHDLQVPLRDCGAYHVLRANVLIALGRHDEALAGLHAQRPHQRAEQGELLGVIEDFCRAAATQHRDGSPDPAVLRRAFVGAARLKFQRFLLSTPTLAGAMCLHALDAGIEPEFVRATVRERCLPCPDPSRADWPWRLRVRLLGSMRLERDDLPLRWSGKAPRKPLELLFTLAAAGGEPIDQATLIDALWPSLEADAPRASLEMAITRLRRLLDLPEAVIVTEGTVALDSQRVWCDTQAFESLAKRLLAPGRQGADAHVALSTHADLFDRALALWGGPLLGLDSLNPPLALARERLSGRYRQLALQRGAQLEQEQRWAEAGALYEQALHHEVLAEPLYRALMRTQLALGERADAVRTYRRCRDRLAEVLGTAPGESTEALHRQACT